MSQSEDRLQTRAREKTARRPKIIVGKLTTIRTIVFK
jgi:hypothetical protein